MRASDVTWMSGSLVLESYARTLALTRTSRRCPRTQWSLTLHDIHTDVPAKLSSHVK